jgi:hypothetical protein
MNLINELREVIHKWKQSGLSETETKQAVWDYRITDNKEIAVEVISEKEVEAAYQVYAAYSAMNTVGKTHAELELLTEKYEEARENYYRLKLKVEQAEQAKPTYS